jgi:endo-1,4-beta-xylanase
MNLNMGDMKKYILIALLFLFNISLSIKAQNLLTNGDFESGSTNWTFVLTSYATASIVSDTVHSGTNSLKIQVDTLGSNEDDLQLNQVKFSDQKGFAYNLSFYAKTDSPNYQISVEFKDTMGITSFDKKNFILTNTWVKYEFVFIAPVTAKNFAKFFINFKSLGPSYFDDFSLVKLNSNWLNGSSYRIEKYRKGNFSVKVQDSLGNPVSDSVYIRMVKHEFPWGTASDFTNSWENAMALKFFNCGVFGNAFKWSYMEPSPGTYTYGNVNNALAWAKKVGWTLRGHCLLWGDVTPHDENKMPGWVRALTPAKAIYDTIKNRVVNTMNYYKGKVNDYDVLNEPTHANWLQTTHGDSINWKAFKWAHETDSTANLCLNEYNTIEQNNDEYRAYIAVLRKILTKGGPVTSIGIQGHFGGSVPEGVVIPRLDSMAQFGLPLLITEFDLDLNTYPISAAAQAWEYAKMMRIAFSYPSVNGFLFWGFWNANQWRGGGIFEKDKTPKIAADSVYNLIHKEWNTNISGKTSSDGSLSFRGFYGDYEVTVKTGDSLKLFKIKCNKADDGAEFVIKENEGVLAGPVVVSAAVTYYDSLELTFNKEMTDPSSEINNFGVFDQGSNPVTVAKLKPGNSKVIVMHLNKNLTFASTVTISYLPGGQLASDSSKLEAFNMLSAANPLPGIKLLETDTTGYYVEITFNREINDPSSEVSAFTVKVNGSIDTINTVSLKSGNSSVLRLSLKKAIKYGQLVSFAYTPGNLTSANGFPILKANTTLVINKVPNTSSVAEVISKDVKMFPNPAQNVLNVTNLNSVNRIAISTILGQEIYRNDNIKATSVTINIADFNKGVYIVSFGGHNTIVKTMKLIKY